MPIPYCLSLERAVKDALARSLISQMSLFIASCQLANCQWWTIGWSNSIGKLSVGQLSLVNCHWTFNWQNVIGELSVGQIPLVHCQLANCHWWTVRWWSVSRGQLSFSPIPLGPTDIVANRMVQVPLIVCQFKRRQNSSRTILNGTTPASLIVYFWYLQRNIITIFTKNICEKCPSSIRCQDLNPRPLENESPLITTRPGLPP